MQLHYHKYFFILTLWLFTACKSNKLVVEKINTSSTQLAVGSPEDNSVLELINPYKLKIENEMNAVLIVSINEATKGQPESELGNLVADIILKKTNEYITTKADFCMLNNGGLRSSLPQGEITKGKVFELMPFENEIVVITLSGNKTKELFNYIARSGGVPLAGASATLTDSTAIDIKINDVLMNENKTYRIATSDYLSAGGDKMRFFNNPISIEPTKHKLRDAIIEFMIEEHAKGNTLNPKKDGRLKRH